ncbi:LysR family transcriptional regulator [Paraburkholderia sp. BCC1884]|uniref:LysR family transcriptional regulator n=1 Tax=Paraburkholderia sp. BCC1884 TaxID=2562668 RepID=UPI0016428517|nr:LysR family transcriptional regulator [Paraburkholderia sp. BCC1884]
MKKSHEGPDNLDFLLVIEAILAHRTITGAARALGVGQSALSHALSGLREKFEDPLFVRVGNEMRPTPLVVELAEPIGRSLKIVREEILSRPEFDPATTTRTFHICVSETGSFIIVPRVLRLLRHRAPLAHLIMHNTPRSEIAGALEDGKLDVAIGYHPHLRTSFYQQLLFSRAFVGIVSENNARVGDSVTLKQLSGIPVVRTPGTSVINQWLDQKLWRSGKMQVALESQYVMALAPILAETDWMGIISEELVSAFKKLARLRVVSLPKDVPHVSIRQHWHLRYKDDGANRFLREVVYDALRDG